MKFQHGKHLDQVRAIRRRGMINNFYSRWKNTQGAKGQDGKSARWMTFALANYANFGQAQDRAAHPHPRSRPSRPSLFPPRPKEERANERTYSRESIRRSSSMPLPRLLGRMNSSADKKTSMLQLEQARSVTRPRRLPNPLTLALCFPMMWRN